MLVLNMWGAPSSGKSTTAAGLFFLMKINRLRVELVNEFAKELVYEQREDLFSNQLEILVEQNRRLRRVAPHVDYVITDSPLPLALFYSPSDYLPSFPAVCLEQYHQYENLNFYLRRTKHVFEPGGRRHTEAESQVIDTSLKELLRANDLVYHELAADPSTPETIFREFILPGLARAEKLPWAPT